MAHSKPKRKKKNQRSKFNITKAINNNKQRIVELCKGVGCDITDKLTANDFLDIYVLNVEHGEVRCHSDYDINPQIILNLKSVLKIILSKRIHDTIIPTDIKLCINDLYMIEGLMHYIENNIETDVETKKELDKDIKYLEEYYGPYHHQSYLADYFVCDFLKDINFPTRYIYILQSEMDKTLNHKNYRCRSIYYVKKYPPTKEYVNINKHSRPIYKLQQPFFDLSQNETILEDCFIKAELLKDVYSGTKTELPVFIQKHAADRVCERLYPIDPIVINKLISTNLYQTAKVCYYNNKIMFELVAPIGKYGYFLAQIINDKIVLQTFLLVSTTSTPEGDKFRNLTGFNKYDLDYWDLDCLPTFINNSMDKDNHLYSYFEQAGLLHLFNLKQDAIKTMNPEYDYAAVLNWDKLESYINTNSKVQELYHTEM